MSMVFLLLLAWVISPAANAQIGYSETGNASYYADMFHGRKTANGERFNMNAYTAAHRTLPFGTKLRVTNLDNEASVVVRVNDRGPYVNDRIIDLSRAAAQDIGITDQGLGKVRILVLDQPTNVLESQPDKPDTAFAEAKDAGHQPAAPQEENDSKTAGANTPPPGTYSVQLGAFSSKENANTFRRKLKKKGFSELRIEARNNIGSVTYNVLMGQYANESEARKAAAKAKDKGQDAFITVY